MFCLHDRQPRQTFHTECRLIVCTKCGKRWLEVSRNPEARPELLPWTVERERFYGHIIITERTGDGGSQHAADRASVVRFAWGTGTKSGSRSD